MHRLDIAISALKDIREKGTRKFTERTGDMYADDGYTDYEEISDEAEIAIEALRLLGAE